MNDKVIDITNRIVEILEYMNTDYITQLRKQDQVLYERTIENQFPDFTEKYYSVLKLLMSGDDITRLMEMLSQLEKVEKNEKSRDDVINQIREELNNEYVYKVLKK